MDSKLFQEMTERILEQALETTKERRKQYGDITGNNSDTVFEQTASIITAISGEVYLPSDVIRIFLGMKLARYSRQLNSLPSKRSEETIRDSLIDAIVYLALLEADRRLSYEHKESNTAQSQRDVRPLDWEAT